jgi:EmrB/QacA subfamily drug resistance transporter
MSKGTSLTQTTSTRPPEETPAPAHTSLRDSLSSARRTLVVAGMMLGMLLAALDQTIVGTAMPRVIADLHGLEHYAWVVTAYMLASTATVPIYGKLSDLYGRRPFFLGGMGLFLLGSALSGTSQDMTQLIVFRAVQGLGAGAIFPIVQAMGGDLFPMRERGKFQGMFMSMFALANIVGPTLGGFITDSWGWRWVFYVNMPVGILAILITMIGFPRQTTHREHVVDYAGAASLIAATVPLLLALSWAGTQYAWASVEVLGLLGLSVAAWFAFYQIERRASEPIIDPRFFGNRTFTISIAAMFLSSGGMFGAILFLPLFIQGVLGVSAAESGRVLIPMMLGFTVSGIAGGQVLARTGHYRWLAVGGFVVGAIGLGLFSRLDASATQQIVILNMLITGLGMGVLMSLFVVVVQNAFPPAVMGQVTSSLTFFRSIGATIGVAVFGWLMTTRFNATLDANLPAVLKQMGLAEKLADPRASLSPEAAQALQQQFATLGPQGQELFTQTMTAVRIALATSITGVFAAGAAAMVIGAVLCAFLKEVPLRGHAEETGGQSAASPVGASEG